MSETENSTLRGILASAKSEFLEKGYRNASLRSIAGRAGVTTGALYGYFRNKAGLFRALVGEAYEHTREMYQNLLESFFRLPPEEQPVRMEDYSRQGMLSMAEYMYDHRDEFKLILCCSEGTEYANMVHEMARLDVQATHDFARITGEAGMPTRAVNPTLEHMLTSGMFATFFELIVHDVPREEAGEYITQMLTFYSGGWSAVMGF